METREAVPNKQANCDLSFSQIHISLLTTLSNICDVEVSHCSDTLNTFFSTLTSKSFKEKIQIMKEALIKQVNSSGAGPVQQWILRFRVIFSAFLSVKLIAHDCCQQVTIFFLLNYTSQPHPSAEVFYCTIN